MITRVWGSINDVDVVFTPVPDRPHYWEGIGPRVDGLQNIVIWAETAQGSIRRLAVSVAITWDTETTVKLILMPYMVSVINRYTVRFVPSHIRRVLIG